MPKNQAQQFKNVVEAARLYREAEDHLLARQWTMGDAIIEALGPPGERGVKSGAKVALKRLGSVLTKAGYSFELRRLQDFWITASNFPAERRRLHSSFDTHVAAGDPGTLDKIVGTLTKKKHPITVKNVRAEKKRLQGEQQADQARNGNADAAQSLTEQVANAIDQAKEAKVAAARFRTTVDECAGDLTEFHRADLRKHAAAAFAAWKASVEAIAPAQQEAAE